jgi:hypothetical protein
LQRENIYFYGEYMNDLRTVLGHRWVHWQIGAENSMLKYEEVLSFLLAVKYFI